MTWEQFTGLDDEDPRELIDGRLVEIDVPSKLHEWIVAVLLRHLANWALPRRAGIVLPSGYKVRISEHRGVMPDLQFFRAGRTVPDSGLTSGGPDLVVEVVSPTSGRYDRVEKLNWYAAIGVPEYWIIDPEQRTLTRHLLEQGTGYRIADALADAAELSPNTFPGLQIALAELWELPDWF